ncbi:hypothetical protein BDM02DRAFT_3270872, partial [Thelephora ganbajun]
RPSALYSSSPDLTPFRNSKRSPCSLTVALITLTISSPDAPGDVEVPKYFLNKCIFHTDPRPFKAPLSTSSREIEEGRP